MALTREQSEIWQAMNIGPQWILRDAQDPLMDDVGTVAPQAKASVHAHPDAAAGSSAARPAALAPRAPIQTPAASVRPALVRSPAARKVNAVPAAPAPETAVPDAQLIEEVKTASWEDIAKIVDRCQACPMAHERTHTVCCDGQPGCPIVIVGEAPGRDEDIEGVPFVGKSGQLLTAILDVVGLKRREDVAIVNVLKCRPPRNRDPRPDEIAACSAFLDRQLELLSPKVLLLMGRHAVERVLGKTESIARLRNQTFTVKINGQEVPAIVTYHPSYLLRSPVEKEKSWHDVLRARKLMQSLQ